MLQHQQLHHQFGIDCEFCNIFNKLQDHTKPHPDHYTNQCMEHAYGPNWMEYIQLLVVVVLDKYIVVVLKSKRTMIQKRMTLPIRQLQVVTL
jgi:hypothetical protein